MEKYTLQPIRFLNCILDILDNIHPIFKRSTSNDFYLNFKQICIKNRTTKYFYLFKKNNLNVFPMNSEEFSIKIQ